MINPLFFLEKDKLLNCDMIELIQRNEADILYSEEDGVLLLEKNMKDGYACYSMSAENENAASKMAGLITYRKEFDLILHQNQFEKAVRNVLELDEKHCEPCYLEIYEKKEAPALTNVAGIDIKPLTMGDYNFVCKNYDAGAEYIKDRIRFGMVGAFDNGKCVGFGGFHHDGSIGFLTVLPSYRKRGIAKALTTRLIARAIKEKRTPFSHVFFGNDVSLAFHESMGFTKMDRDVCWIFK